MSSTDDRKGATVVMPLLVWLFRVGATEEAGADKITLDDVEVRLRSLTDNVRSAVLSSKRNTIAAGVLGGIATIGCAYLHGRRRGRRRATVLEVVRK
jgi:hypothetical protein